MKLAALTIVLALGAAFRQSLPPPLTGSIRIVVVDAGSGVPIEGADVTVERARGTPISAVTNLTGTVEVSDLATGKYIVKVTYKGPPDAPDSAPQLTPLQSQQTEVKAGATSVLEFTIRRPATLRGQVSTPEGRPVVGAPVSVLAVQRTYRGRPVLSPGSASDAQAITDADGRFVVASLTPGRYFVRVALPAIDRVPLNDVYAPGTVTTTNAMPVTLESGDDVSIGVSAIAVPTVSVEGRVVDQSGQRVESIQIRLRPLDRLRVGAADDATTSDRDGHFVIRNVGAGLYALQAVGRGGGTDATTVVGATEVDVAEQPVAPLEIAVAPGAVLAGQMFFNGVQRNDSARVEIRVKAEGNDADLREGLVPTPEWHPDGSFSVSGVVGPHRLTLHSGTNWFIERAVLEDGTDVADGALNFEPGRVYRKVRVLLSDQTADIVGKLPKGWDKIPIEVVAFPEDSSLWSSTSYVKVATATTPQTEVTIKGIPPGRNYLVAIFVLPAGTARPGESLDQPAFLDALAPVAARVFVGEPGKITVDLPNPRR
jgi:Carboxypeptidase regulatory-like domain